MMVQQVQGGHKAHADRPGRRWSPRRLATLAAGSALAAVVSVVAAVPAQAAFPGDNGKIYFVESSTIFSMNPDGSGVTTVTRGLNSSAPRVSADGTKVAFLKYAGGPNFQVHTMNPDGTGVTQLTSGAGADGRSLAWSPDGTKLVYRPGGTLTVINADGTNPVSLGVNGSEPNWSPDGTKIVYNASGAINTINPDGTGQTTLASTPGVTYFAPNWSPDSTKITFTAFSFDPLGNHVFTMNADGSNQTNISTENNDRASVWSPDGTKILFGDNDGLLVMDPDGTNRTRIHTNTIAPAQNGDWAAIPAPTPTVTAVNPASGPTTGGTIVTITGTKFTGATAVAFGTTAATSFTVNSDTSITATAPAATAGPVDVTVTTSSGTSATNPADRYTYTYAFTGFFPPVDNPPAVNTRNAGSTVPVKFSLGGNQGPSIFPPGSPASQQYDCTTGTPIGAPQATTGSLNYDTGSGRYQYTWRTDAAWADTCRHLQVTLTDGTTHTADFKFH
ncbi:PxKF domain-containing protein [Actinocrispum wychmicini]|uniref:WD40 repeat protein n=1 Tax=Actinocrispum wychmicini TaxID=1213861 RepID=A0A4V2S7V6_9PSEU|nr:PxKF domain-containing protein [Actinocrispum wychmicini]TCO61100.1 WD40 repeat protein [Actinocrispum wychmicini]